MPTHPAEMPVVRDDHQYATANQRAVCPHGNNYGSCLDFVCKGPASCYCCGYREGFRDGWDDGMNYDKLDLDALREKLHDTDYLGMD